MSTDTYRQPDPDVQQPPASDPSASSASSSSASSASSASSSSASSASSSSASSPSKSSSSAPSPSKASPSKASSSSSSSVADPATSAFFAPEAGGPEARATEFSGPEKGRRSTRSRAVLALGAIILGAGGTAAIAKVVQGDDPAPQPATQADQPAPVRAPDAPAAVAAPPGVVPVALYRVDIGNQVYICKAKAFTLKAPEARLINSAGHSIQHLGGPSWRSNTDQSAIVGAKLAESPVPDAIPELLLKVKEHLGNPAGELSTVTHIQRLNTTGGVAPAGACVDGAERSVPYTADYVFFAPR